MKALYYKTLVGCRLGARIPKAILNFVIDYILPPRCLSCAQLATTNDGFCPACWNKFVFISKPYCKVCGCKLDISIFEDYSCGKCLLKAPAYDAARSLIKYNEHSKRVVHSFKYHDKTGLAKTFSRLLCLRYREELKNIDLIVPVPMHKLKRLVRNYNQSFILAAEIGKIIQRPLLYDALIKTKWTKAQTSLSRAARLKNLAGSLKFNSSYDIKGKHILLVDDVLTTGSTVSKCSELLKKAGAKSVLVVTIAMT